MTGEFAAAMQYSIQGEDIELVLAPAFRELASGEKGTRKLGPPPQQKHRN
jgi:hypothetical protein